MFDMVMLTGGEKYNTKQLIIKVNVIYMNIQSLVESDSELTMDSLNDLYDATLMIFMTMATLTVNIINSTPKIKEIFDLLQEVHYYNEVNDNNKDNLIKVAKMIPQLQDELIGLVENDTSNRDAVLRQIMDELGIVDPNAKKKRSLW